MAGRSLFDWLSNDGRKSTKEGEGKMRTSTTKFRLALVALVLSLGVVTVPMAETAEASPGPATLHVSKWTEYAENPVFGREANSPGHDASDQCVIKIDDTYYMYYTAPDSEGQNWIYYATSSDGICWIEGGKVAELVNQYEENGIDPSYWAYKLYPADPWVLYDGTTYHLYYEAAMNWLRHATSLNGITWTDQGLITVDGMDATFVGPFTAYYDDGTYYAWFVSHAGNLFYATSLDGHNWTCGVEGGVFTTDGSNPHYGDWRDFGPCGGLTVTGYTDGGENHQFTRPCVLKEGDTYHMWFGGDKARPHSSTWDVDIGHAVSEDGKEWTLVDWIFSKDDGVDWRCEATFAPQVIKEGGTHKMWFSGKDGAGNYAVGYATAGPFLTIQSAIDAADPGDTILVAAGTYKEHIEIAKSSLTLKGIGDPPPVIDGGWTVETVVYVHDATNVTVENFEVTGGTGDLVYGENADNITIRSVIAHGSTGDEGIQVKYSDNVTIEDCTSYGNMGDGICVSYGSGHLIRHNLVYDNDDRGIYLYGDWSGKAPLSDARIEGNTVYGTQGTVPGGDDRFKEGGIICYYTQGIEIVGNFIYGNTGPGIHLYKMNHGRPEGVTSCVRENHVHDNAAGDTPGDGIRAYLIYNTIISNNELYNNAGAGVTLTTQYPDGREYTFEEANSGVQVRTNDIYRNTYGLQVIGRLGDHGIHLNNIHDNTDFGADASQAAEGVTVDAISNWWGSVYGPLDETGTIECLAPFEGGWNCSECDKNTEPGGLLGDKVRGSVDYCPWLGASARYAKQNALAKLNGIYPTGENKVDHSIKKAIEDIEKSLNIDPKHPDKPWKKHSLWLDDNHLDPNHGREVFDEEKKAVKELNHLMDKKDTLAEVKPVCQEVIDELIKADYMLARTAIDEAIAAGGNSKEIDKAEEEMAKAQEELDHTKKDGTLDPRYDKAIDHYKKAWEHACKAQKPKPGGLRPEAVEDQLRVVMSPNPIRDVHTARFYVMGAMADEVEEIRVQIYDLSGRLVMAAGLAKSWGRSSSCASRRREKSEAGSANSQSLLFFENTTEPALF